MELLKLIGVTLAIVVLIFGGLALALTRRKKVKDEGNCNTPFYEETSHASCGCGSGACGLPAEKSAT